MKTFQIEYDGCHIATVAVDTREAFQPIKEMVEFWSGWKARKEKAGGYLEAWLQQLGHYIAKYGIPPPDDEEGWHPLDGSCGIELKDWDAWEFQREEFFITEED